MESRLHLDPVWKPEKVTLNSLELVIPTRKMNLRFFKDGQLSIHQGEVNPIMGWYAPEFGQKVPAPCIHWVNQAQLPYQTGFICYPSQVNLDCRVDDQGIYLNSNRSEYVFRLESGTIKILSRSS